MSSLITGILKFHNMSRRRQAMRRDLASRLQLPSGISFQVARTMDDFSQAFRLTHDCYVGLGILRAHVSGMRCNRYSVAPGSTVLVAKDGDLVVATVTLVPDGIFGLPSDAEYRAENNRLRRGTAKLIEVSGMAVHPDYRKHATSAYLNLYLMSYLTRFSDRHLGGTHLIAVVHPKSQEFYESIFGFTRSGRILKYNFANGALAVHLSTRIDALFNYIKAYCCKDAELARLKHLFFENQIDGFQLPRQSGIHVVPSCDLDTFSEIFDQSARAFDDMSIEELLVIKSYYELYLDIHQTGHFRFLRNRTDYRQFRFPTGFSGELYEGSSIFQGALGKVSVSNLSTTGCQVILPKAAPQLARAQDAKLLLGLGLPGNRQYLQGRIAWQHDAGIDGVKMGIGFSEKSEELTQLLTSIHLRQEPNVVVASTEGA